MIVCGGLLLFAWRTDRKDSAARAGPRRHLAARPHSPSRSARRDSSRGCADELAASSTTPESVVVVAHRRRRHARRSRPVTRVRLVQIDAPELGEGECYAREAQRELERLAPPGSAHRDRGRSRVSTTATATDVSFATCTPRDVNVNVELVRRGAATPYFRGGDEGSYADDLLDAVDDARRETRGMWGACRVSWQPDRAVTTRSR